MDEKTTIVLVGWMVIGVLAGVICGLINRKKTWDSSFRTVFYLGMGFIVGTPVSAEFFGNQYSRATFLGTILETACCWFCCRIVWWLYNRSTPTTISSK